jgi:hypothetical protein
MPSLQGPLGGGHDSEKRRRAGRHGCNPIQCTQNKQKGNLSENCGVTIDTGEANYRQDAGKRSDGSFGSEKQSMCIRKADIVSMKIL